MIGLGYRKVVRRPGQGGFGGRGATVVTVLRVRVTVTGTGPTWVLKVRRIRSSGVTKLLPSFISDNPSTVLLSDEGNVDAHLGTDLCLTLFPAPQVDQPNVR